MTIEEINNHLHEALNSVDITFPYRYVLVEAIEALSRPSLPDGLEEAAEEFYPDFSNSIASKAAVDSMRDAFIVGAKWQKDKILKLIEARISEIIGDAQPNPVLRLELQGIIDKIK